MITLCNISLRDLRSLSADSLLVATQSLSPRGRAYLPALPSQQSISSQPFAVLVSYAPQLRELVWACACSFSVAAQQRSSIEKLKILPVRSVTCRGVDPCRHAHVQH